LLVNPPIRWPALAAASGHDAQHMPIWAQRAEDDLSRIPPVL
jgi:hypothetical protein